MKTQVCEVCQAELFLNHSVSQIPLFPAAFSHVGCSLLQLRNLPSTQVKLFPSSGPCRPPDLDLIVGLSIHPCFISVLQVARMTWLPRLPVWLWIISLSSRLLALLSAPWLPECDAHAFNILILDKKGQANQPTTKTRGRRWHNNSSWSDIVNSLPMSKNTPLYTHFSCIFFDINAKVGQESSHRKELNVLRKE